MDNIQIAIVDDHELFREGLALVMKQTPGFSVQFEFSGGHEFLDCLTEEKPDIVLMDIEMPGINGIETTKKAIEKHPELRVIALTMFSNSSSYTPMIDAGVRGFVLKKAHKKELEYAIKEVYAGGSYFSQEILQKLAFQHGSARKSIENLTLRETEILSLVCQGFTSQQIAGNLFISPKTVEIHRSNIFHKANVRNIAELIVWAVKNELFVIK